jgi:hypothetical protein
MTIDKLASAFLTALRQGGEQLADAVLERGVARYGRSFTEVALRRAQQCLNAEHAAPQAEYARECAFHEFAMAMFNGLPRNTTLGEACAIKAAQGNEAARHYLEAAGQISWKP